MKSKEAIDNEIKALPTIDKWGTKQEIALLPKILNDDEIIKSLASGLKTTVLIGSGSDPVLLVCTNKRVIFVQKKIFSEKIDDISLSNIVSITNKKGILFSEVYITLNSTKKKLCLKKINHDAAIAFVNAVNEQKEAMLKPTINVTGESMSIADEISKLKSLMDSGVLTVEEFNKEKEKILNR